MLVSADDGVTVEQTTTVEADLLIDDDNTNRACDVAVGIVRNA